MQMQCRPLYQIDLLFHNILRSDIFSGGQDNGKHSGYEIKLFGVLPQVECRGTECHLFCQQPGYKQKQSGKDLHYKTCQEVERNGEQYPVTLKKLPQCDAEINLYDGGEAEQNCEEKQLQGVSA